MSQKLTDDWSEFLGITDFFECIGNYEWSIFTVEASLDAVMDKLLNLQTIQRWKSLRLKALGIDIEKRTTHTSGLFGGIVPVVELDSWTCVPWTPCWYAEDIAGFQGILELALESEGIKSSSKRVQTIPKTLSEELNTQVVTFFAEDTDGLIGYQIFSSGRSVEHFVHVPADRLFWQSDLREAPDNDFDDEDYLENCVEGALSPAEQFVSNRFCELGIYIPDCYVVHQQEKVWLEGNNRSLEQIRRASALQIL